MNITLATLAKATPQEIFDQVASHLLTQGRQSLSAQVDGGCAYRGTDGCRCAAGCLISDDEYRPGMESRTWVDVYRIFKTLPYAGTATIDLIDVLQTVHDACEPYEWREELRSVAKSYGLSDKVLEAFA
ncbi:hypothetical protein FHW69_001634 [Luteibacter sp. Sphag1AF]|uniref:hypothetical protein n=1 Tax=Luteibacter sp. Sphag1AF TaxID=2587031 RepID=UPI00160E5DFF|nr:hypothetical protein [Luteibacter sp. Sphag1AF]MBB3227033.1 hypothetical protein [Luteibacter sp. Sphag1AF]